MFKCAVPKKLENDWTLDSLIEEIGNKIEQFSYQDKKNFRTKGLALIGKLNSKYFVITKDKDLEFVFRSMRNILWFTVPKHKACTIADNNGVPLRERDFRNGW